MADLFLLVQLVLDLAKVWAMALVMARVVFQVMAEAEELDPQDMALALARALVWAKVQLMVQSDWARHPPFD